MWVTPALFARSIASSRSSTNCLAFKCICVSNNMTFPPFKQEKVALSLEFDLFFVFYSTTEPFGKAVSVVASESDPSGPSPDKIIPRSEEHTSELQSRGQ